MKKLGIPQWEKAILIWVQKHIYPFLFLISSAMALYLRKIAVWYNYEHILVHFDHHKLHTESSFYYVILHLTEYLPILPLHSFKWLAGLSDFALAALAAWYLGKKNQLKEIVLYICVLFSPVVYLRSIIWAQPDSTALCLLFAGYICLQKKDTIHRTIGIIALTIALSIAPFLTVPAVIYTAYKYANDHTNAGPKYITIATLAMLCIQSLSALTLGETWQEGLSSAIRFGTYTPFAGELYTDPATWLYQMILLYGLPISCLGIYQYTKKPTKTQFYKTIIIHIIVTLCYSSQLFQTPLY